MFKNYFNFAVPSALAKQLHAAKDKNKNDKLVEEIKKRWSDLKDETEKCLKMKKILKKQIEY